MFSKYRISEALMEVYHLFWDEFSSWYLEMIKPAYGEPIDGKTMEATLGETLNDDTITVSFMTCDPGTEIYALYGHSAIRIRTASGADWVFNYGMFDFHTSNFVGRFVLGKTDYYMAAFPFEIGRAHV